MPSMHDLFVPNLALVEHDYAVVEADSKGLAGNETGCHLATAVISIQTIDEVLGDIDKGVWL